MRVIIINQHLNDTLGGSEIQCDLIARGLTERGHEVVYIAPMRSSILQNDLPYSLKPVNNNPVSILDAAREYAPDVVYWRYNLHYFRSVAHGLHRQNISLVFAASHINDLLPWVWHRPGKGIINKARQLVRRRWNRGGFRHVQAITTNNRDFLTLSPVSNASYIPNGMNNEAEPFHWPRPFVAWIANIKPAKRPECFVEVTRALADHGIDGLMVGHIQSSGYEWLLDSQQVPHNLHYLGTLTPLQVNGLLAASRLHIHTCQPEGFPNVFLQAWMQGRPSVSLEYDPCGYIQEQAIGVVAGGDMHLFKEQVIEWATQSKKANEAGQRAQSFAQATFSVDTMVAKVEQVLEGVVEHSSSSR